MASPESNQIRKTLVKDYPSTTPIAVQRQEWEQVALQAALPPNLSIEDMTANGVACEWVVGSRADRSKVLLWVHGGGFSSGSAKTHREFASHLSEATGMAVLLVDYRLAPEYPFPAAIADVTAVYEWLIAQGWKVGSIVIGGDSAGANLVVAGLVSLRASGKPMPAAAVLTSAWLDLTHSGESMTTNAAVDPLTTLESLKAAAQVYAGGKDVADPLISPLFAELHDLPPMLIQVGGDEILLSDSTRFAERLEAAGVEAQLDVWPEMWHTWHGWMATLPEARRAIEVIGQYVKGKVTV